MKKKQLKQVKNQAQDGRSMVEMLGVLAIIGVLSIGGIAGYRMAMNRYQANQIANEINLMRTDAKIKVARGVDELLLGEPYDGDDGHLNFNANYGVAVKFEEIGTDTPGETEKGYSFTLSNIPEGVCKPLVALLDNMDDTADIKIGDESYYDENEDFCGETNEVMVAFSSKDLGGMSSGSDNPPTDTEQGDESQNAPVCNLDTCPRNKCNEDGTCDCPEGTTWNNGECICADNNQHLYGNQCVSCEGGTWDSTSKRCKCDNGIWDMEEGKCVNASCGTGETTCNDNQYCDTSPTSSCSNGKNTNASKGTCKDIDIESVKEKTINGKTYYYKTGSFDWWSAQRYCQALAANGKGHGLMVSLEELGCEKGKTGSGACADGALLKALNSTCKEGEACCTEGVLCCDKDDNCPSFSSGVWISTTRGSNSCFAYYVSLNSGFVSSNNRYGNYYTLCE